MTLLQRRLNWWHCYSAVWTEVMTLLQRCLNWSYDIITAPFELKWWHCYSAVWTEVMTLLQRRLNWSDNIVTASSKRVKRVAVFLWTLYRAEQKQTTWSGLMTDVNDRFPSPLIPSASKVMERYIDTDTYATERPSVSTLTYLCVQCPGPVEHIDNCSISVLFPLPWHFQLVYKI
jgi:hypothetical protein